MATKSRTQQERRQDTKRKLLRATIDCLIEEGYNAVTTTKVCQRSGMSQGAIFKHYPTKHALLTAAIERLYEQLIDTYQLLVKGIPTTGDRIPICLQALWTLFELPELLAVFDLHTAARTDLVLQKALEPFESRHREHIRQVAANIFPEAADNPKLQAGIDLVLMVVQGTAVGNLALREPDVQRLRAKTLERVARVLLEDLHE